MPPTSPPPIAYHKAIFSAIHADGFVDIEERFLTPIFSGYVGLHEFCLRWQYTLTCEEAPGPSKQRPILRFYRIAEPSTNDRVLVIHEDR